MLVARRLTLPPYTTMRLLRRTVYDCCNLSFVMFDNFKPSMRKTTPPRKV